MPYESNTANHLVKLQEQASLLRVVGRFIVVYAFLLFYLKNHFFFIQFLAVGIALSSALGIGISQGFALITSVTFINSNVTTLEEALDEEEISWLGNEQVFLHMFNLKLL